MEKKSFYMLGGLVACATVLLILVLAVLLGYSTIKEKEAAKIAASTTTTSTTTTSTTTTLETTTTTMPPTTTTLDMQPVIEKLLDRIEQLESRNITIVYNPKTGVGKSSGYETIPRVEKGWEECREFDWVKVLERIEWNRNDMAGTTEMWKPMECARAFDIIFGKAKNVDENGIFLEVVADYRNGTTGEKLWPKNLTLE